jgi:sec-independent protein translocase protein TatA
MSTSFFAMLHMPEIIALLILALILFGAKKLPELARGLGSGIKEFKKATRDVTEELQGAMDFDRPSSSSRSSYPTHKEPGSTDSYQGYGESALVDSNSDYDVARTSKDAATELKPESIEPAQDPIQPDPTESEEATEVPAPERVGKSD